MQLVLHWKKQNLRRFIKLQKKQVKIKEKVWVQKTYAEKNFDWEKAAKGDSFDKKFVIFYVGPSVKYYYFTQWNIYVLLC